MVEEGSLWKAVDDDKLEAEVSTLAGTLAAVPTYALGLTKRAIAPPSTNTLAAQLDLERDLQRKAGASLDAAAVNGAFLEKRAPKFVARSK